MVTFLKIVSGFQMKNKTFFSSKSSTRRAILENVVENEIRFDVSTALFLTVFSMNYISNQTDNTTE